jgi:RNA polymerase primary sigma factor
LANNQESLTNNSPGSEILPGADFSDIKKISTEQYLDSLDDPTDAEILDMEENAETDDELVIDHKADGKDGRISSNVSGNFQEDLFGQYVDEIHRNYPTLNDQEQSELFEKIANGSEEDKKQAMKQFIEANLGLVIAPALAKAKTVRGRLTLMDLIQEGNIGLMKGLEKFNPERGIKISTYVMWWIFQAINMAIADQSRPIRMPIHAHDKSNKVFRASSALGIKLGREPTIEEVAGDMGETVEMIKKVRHFDMITDPISLQVIIGSDQKGSEQELGKIISDKNANALEDVAIENVFNESVREALSVISIKERDLEIFKMRFGIDHLRNHTLGEIGEHFGITRERVRQIEFDTINKLREDSNFGKLYIPT